MKNVIALLLTLVACAWQSAACDSVFINQDTTAAWLAQTESAQLTDQIVLVQNHTLSFWERDTTTDNWQMRFATYCGYGRNGFTVGTRHEGDGTTPTGEFELTMAFGIAKDPGAAMPYRRVKKTSYWSGEPEDYNTWVEVKPRTRNMSNSEHLIKYKVPYQYVFAIGFNMNPIVQGMGSAIFLHCKSADHWYTAGCVAIEKPYMRQLIRTCRPGTRIIITPNNPF